MVIDYKFMAGGAVWISFSLPAVLTCLLAWEDQRKEEQNRGPSRIDLLITTTTSFSRPRWEIVERRSGSSSGGGGGSSRKQWHNDDDVVRDNDDAQ